MHCLSGFPLYSNELISIVSTFNSFGLLEPWKKQNVFTSKCLLYSYLTMIFRSTSSLIPNIAIVGLKINAQNFYSTFGTLRDFILMANHCVS